MKPNNPWKIATITLFLIVVITQFYSLGVTITPKSSILTTLDSFIGKKTPASTTNPELIDAGSLEKELFPESGEELLIVWGDLGKKLIDSGVIDQKKFEQLFEKSGLNSEDKSLLSAEKNGKIKINSQNSQFVLDLLWAFGLGNKNQILEKGPINDDPKKTGNFAATGGWDGLSVGSPMSHFSRHQFITLTTTQQSLVEEVSKRVYRPCCGQNTYFPDCNHGMAMLGALELGAAQGLNREELFQLALTLNKYWFKQTYLDIATYFKENGTSWDKVSPEQVLGQDFSSGQGYAATRQKIKSLPKVQESGGGCGA